MALLIEVNEFPAVCSMLVAREVTMMMHAVVWIDHDEARVIHIGRESSRILRILASDRVGHLHHKAGSPGAGHSPVDNNHLAKVAAALAGTPRVLIVGPGTAKTELIAHIREHAKPLVACIAGVEPMDRVTDGELTDHARRYFRHDDRMAP